MAAFPLSPHYSKMLCLSKDRSLLQYMLLIITAMSVQEYLPGENVEAWKKTKLSWADKGEFLLLGINNQTFKNVYINLFMVEYFSSNIVEYTLKTGLIK